MINILTKDNCVQCDYTKKKLAEAGAQYHEMNITKDEAARELLARMGVTQLPVVMWTGFKVDAIKAVTVPRAGERPLNGGT